MDGVEPQCGIKKNDKAIKRKIVGWKMSLMVSRLPDRRHRHPIWITSEGFYSPEGGGISLPDTVLGDLRCRNMRRWDSRCLGPSRPIIPWLDTSHARYVGILFSVSLWGSPTHAGRLSFIESVWNRKKKKKKSLTCNMSCRQHTWFPFLFTTPFVWLFATLTQGFPLQK